MKFKVCPCCKRTFSKPTKYSAKQWDDRVTCSRTCAGIKYPDDEYKIRKLKQFLSNTVTLDNGCMEWKGCLSKEGYGIANLYGKTNNVHRLVYILLHGDIEHCEFVLHSCDNRKCINPHHLFLGSHLDNMADMVYKSRNKSGEACNFSKTTDAQHEQIILQILSGLPAEEIALNFNLSKKHIQHLIRKYSVAISALRKVKD